MTTPGSPAAAREGWSVRADRLGLGLLVVVQAVVFAVAAAPGYFVTDDLQFLYDARPATPNWSYLTLRVNDHLAPGLRLSFWLIRHVTGLDHGPTVVVRVLLLAGLTLLAHHVLTQLLGRRPLTLAATALYALNPVLLTAMTWLATSTNQLPSQALVLTAVSCHIRYVRSGRLRYAALAGLGLGLAACFWESSALTGLVFLWLSLGFLNPGGARERLRRTVGQWRGWALEVAGPVAFAAAFLASGYGSGARAPSFGTLVAGIWDQWADTTAPSLVGGPWRWFSVSNVYVSATDPRVSWTVAVQLLVLVVAVIGWQRLGARALYALAVPVSVGVLGLAAITLGRLPFLGLLISNTVSYAVITLFPAVLALALLLGWPARESPVPREPRLARVSRLARAVGGRGQASGRTRRAGAVATAVVLAASSVVSVSVFAAQWHRNPTGPYVANLEASLRRAGPGTQVFDVPITPGVLPLLSDRRELSYLTDLIGAPVDFVPTGDAGLVADDAGRLKPGSFFRYATAPGDGNQFCGNLVRGVTARTMVLDKPLGAANYVVRLAYFEQHPTPVSVQLRDADGRTVAPLTGPRIVLGSTAGVVYLSFPATAAAGVTVRSEAADANVCLTDVGVGYPFVRSGP